MMRETKKRRRKSYTQNRLTNENEFRIIDQENKTEKIKDYGFYPTHLGGLRVGR